MRKVQLEQIEILWIRDDAMQTAEMVNDRVIFLFMEHGNYPTIIPGDKFVAIVFKRLCTIHGGPEPEIPVRPTIQFPTDWRQKLAEQKRERRPWWKKVWHYIKYPGIQPKDS